MMEGGGDGEGVIMRWALEILLNNDNDYCLSNRSEHLSQFSSRESEVKTKR